jgi:uncharacterized protein
LQEVSLVLKSPMKIDFYIQPSARKTEISGLHDGVIKIKVKAPPVEGAANQELIRFLSDQLNIPKSCMTISSGTRSRHKTVHFDSMTSESSHQVRALLDNLVKAR